MGPEVPPVPLPADRITHFQVNLGWTEEDLLDFAKVVPIGVDDIMQLQERGFAYMSW